MLEKLKERLSSFGYEVQGEDETGLVFCLDKVESYIRHFCNIESIPDDLSYVLIDMAAGEFLQMKKTFSPSALPIDLSAAEKSLSVGDTKVDFALGSGSMTNEERLNALISALLSPPLESLLHYRKLRW